MAPFCSCRIIPSIEDTIHSINYSCDAILDAMTSFGWSFLFAVDDSCNQMTPVKLKSEKKNAIIDPIFLYLNVISLCETKCLESGYHSQQLRVNSLEVRVSKHPWVAAELPPDLLVPPSHLRPCALYAVQRTINKGCPLMKRASITFYKAGIKTFCFDFGRARA